MFTNKRGEKGKGKNLGKIVSTFRQKLLANNLYARFYIFFLVENFLLVYVYVSS